MKIQTDVPVYSACPEYIEAENRFHQLLLMEGLDRELAANPKLGASLRDAVDFALNDAFEGTRKSSESQLFLHRVLYLINRMKLFWYDDLENYVNENSPYLFSLRNEIESAWQHWEVKNENLKALKSANVKEALRQRVKIDLDPEPSEEDLFIVNEMTEAGYRRLLEISSVAGLVEASQLSRMLGGVGNEVQSMLTRIFLEEYGGGRLSRKHSSYFTAMLEALDMDSRPEAYFDEVPWEVLANINLSFLLCENKQNFLRYVGGLLYFETSAPVAFGNFEQAAQRLNLNDEAFGYWKIHVAEDERHGRWMLDEVALPLIDRYGNLAWHLLWGYDEQKFFNGRAGKAIVQSIREIEAF